MKSEALHKFLALYSLLIACAWSTPFQQPVILVKHNIGTENAENYRITLPSKDLKAGEPCLTITWKTNPDGTGPDEPQIYMGDGYFRILQVARGQNNQ
ncbi:GM14956 [Drosophila sechellia]|uniref:GM14956 n=1 Tax=Drosophila sechellia TaxID=7238 RepID=B4IFP7_DROSE|nr:GM14956 [Drosophila sechellia]